MLKLVTIEVFITFVIIAFVLGLILGAFFMCKALKFDDYDKVDSSHHDWFDEK